MHFSFLPWRCTLKMEALVRFCKKTFPGFPTWEIQLLLKRSIGKLPLNAVFFHFFYQSHNIWTSWGAKHWRQYGMYEWQKLSNQRTEMQHFVKWLDTLSFSTKKWGAMNFEMHEILDFSGGPEKLEVKK